MAEKDLKTPDIRRGANSETSDRAHHNGDVRNPDRRSEKGTRSVKSGLPTDYLIAFGALASILAVGLFFFRK